MQGGSNRPHFNKGIAQLETLFQQSLQDITALQSLGRELDQRTTERAERLRRSVAERLQTLAGEPMTAAPDRLVASPASESSRPVQKSQPSQHPAPANPPQPLPPQNYPTPSIEDLGPLPSFPKPKTDDEPAAIIAAWTALEALSPQTYRRPEDLAAGDRRCVADFSNGQVPWGTNERSRPKRQLYYQIILGSIPMAPATEQLVKAFGEDEERAQRAREKAAMAAVLVDKNGIIVEENGIAVSSFAWALPLALKLKLDALGAWPRIEPKIIEKLDAILRRVDSDGNPLPLDLPTIRRAHEWLVAQFGLPSTLASVGALLPERQTLKRSRPWPR